MLGKTVFRDAAANTIAGVPAGVDAGELAGAAPGCPQAVSRRVNATRASRFMGVPFRG